MADPHSNDPQEAGGTPGEPVDPSAPNMGGRELSLARSGRILTAGEDPDFLYLVGEVSKRVGCEAVIVRDFDGFTLANETYQPELILLCPVAGDTDAVEMLRYLGEGRSRADIVLVGGSDIKMLETTERLAERRRLTMRPSLKMPVHGSELRALFRKALNARPTITADELRDGMERREFVPFYQPIVSLSDHGSAVVRAEVLARWQHPFHGMLDAADFIEQADACGMAADLTASLLIEGLGRVRDCHEGGLNLPISINVSAESLTDLRLPDTLAEIVREHDFDNSMVTIELTESSTTEANIAVLDVLTRLRGKGFRLSMDDFGTGYSTLLDLFQLPFDEIKLDRRFIDKVLAQHESELVVASTVGLAHGLGLDVCAEGVESQKTLDVLRRAGCDCAQGRHIKEPVSAGDLMSWLRRWHDASPGAALDTLVPESSRTSDVTLL